MEDTKLYRSGTWKPYPKPRTCSKATLPADFPEKMPFTYSEVWMPITLGSAQWLGHWLVLCGIGAQIKYANLSTNSKLIKDTEINPIEGCEGFR